MAFPGTDLTPPCCRSVTVTGLHDSTGPDHQTFAAMLRRRPDMWVTIGLDCQKYIPELPVAFKKAIHSRPTGPGSLHEPPTEEKVQPSFATDAELP
ncbi:MULTISPECIES: hypothetical protein [Actinomycetes]|uniref:Uncharacterized protein n=1 Tax=Nocardia testacea TaxID=248551 RepID=A0ABW7W6U7_9NOCA